MNVLAQVKTAIEAIRAGREAISSITDAIRDGRAALNTTDQSELNRLLAEEQRETEAASTALQRAIQIAKTK